MGIYPFVSFYLKKGVYEYEVSVTDEEGEEIGTGIIKVSFPQDNFREGEQR